MDSTKRTRSDSSYKATPVAMKRSRSGANAIPMPDQASDLAGVKGMTDKEVSNPSIYFLELHLI